MNTQRSVTILCIFSTIYIYTVTCVPECMNGVCRDPRVCVCDDGYTGEECSQG